MDDIMKYAELASSETDENRLKAIYNLKCVIDGDDSFDLQSHDDSAFLEVINKMNSLIIDAFRMPKDLLDV